LNAGLAGNTGLPAVDPGVFMGRPPAVILDRALFGVARRRDTAAYVGGRS
jgi:hypothetical protein